MDVVSAANRPALPTSAESGRIRVDVSNVGAASLMRAVAGSAQCCQELGMQVSQKAGDAGAAALFYLGFRQDINGRVAFLPNSIAHRGVAASAQVLQAQAQAQQAQTQAQQTHAAAQCLAAQNAALRQQLEALKQQAEAQQAEARAAQRLLESLQQQAAAQLEQQAESLRLLKAAERSRTKAVNSNEVLAANFFRTLKHAETTQRFIKVSRAQRTQLACSMLICVCSRVVRLCSTLPKVALATTSLGWILGAQLHKYSPWGEAAGTGTPSCHHHHRRPDLWVQWNMQRIHLWTMAEKAHSSRVQQPPQLQLRVG